MESVRGEGLIVSTRFARVGGAHVAYRTWGEGPPDLLYFEELPVDMLEDEPRLARALRRLSSFARVICFNARGLGLSDALGRPGAPTDDERLEDAVAVVDAAAAERVTALGLSFMGHHAIDFAVRQQDRTASLVLFNARARWLYADDYRFGFTPEQERSFVERITDPETDRATLPNPAASVREDAVFWLWWERAGHRRATPTMAAAVMEMRSSYDYRALLPLISCPTLVIHRTQVEQILDIGHGRFLAEHIPGARLVELPGADMIWWVGDDTDIALDEIELFVSGGAAPKRKRVLATVLFVDVVGSTERAADIGDQRWRELLETYNAAVASCVGRLGGRLVGTEGDGALATFELPVDAIECARALRSSGRALGIDIRAGAHTGEVEVTGEDIAGLGVHIAARVMSAAGAGEILVSRTVADLVTGSGISFEDRGERELKGVPGTWSLFAVNS